MDESKWADFEKFRDEHEKALKRIATATRKEHSGEDVVNEAWLMGCELSAKKGLAIAFLDPGFQRLLLSHLRQKLVHYTEKKIRNAVRLQVQHINGAYVGAMGMTTNITLRLDEKTLRRIRHLAVDQQTSVSAWVENLGTRAVAELDGFEPARRRALRAMKHPVPVREGPLSREQAHER